MKYQIISVLEESKDTKVYKVYLEEKKEIAVLKQSKHKEILRQEKEKLEYLSGEGMPTNLAPRYYYSYETNQEYFLFMEFIRGMTLEEYVVTKNIADREAVELIEAIGYEIDKLHCLSDAILFRDLKPSNIMVCDGGRVRLLDFGGAKYISDKGCKWRVGSPSYAAPEQFKEGERESILVDIYGLGSVFYYILTGEPPDTINMWEEKVTLKFRDIIEKSRKWEAVYRYQEVSLMLHDIKRAFYEPRRGQTFRIALSFKRRIIYEKNIHIRPLEIVEKLGD